MRRIILGVMVAVLLAACTNYGKKVSKDNIEVYYKDGITKEQAEKTLNFLIEAKKESNSPTKNERKSFQLAKGTGDTILFRMVVDKAKAESAGDDAFATLGKLLSENSFNGTPINVLLTDKSFKPFKTIAYNSTAGSDYGDKVKSGNVEVYVKDGLSQQTGEELAAFLDRTMTPPTTFSFQYSKSNEGYNVVSMLSDETKVATVSTETMADMAKKISDSVMNGSPLIFQMTDGYFKPLKKYEYDVAPAPDTTAVQ